MSLLKNCIITFLLFVLFASVATAFDVSIRFTGTSLCINAPQSFRADVSVPGSYSYQWQFSRNNGSTWSNFLDATTPDFTLLPSEDFEGSLIRAVVTDGNGLLFSNTLRLQFLRPPVITSSPRDTSICIGETAQFSVNAANINFLRLQWQQSVNSGLTWTDIPGATSPTISVGLSLGQNVLLVRAVLSSACTTISRNAALRLRRKTEITAQSGNISVCEGSDSLLFVRLSTPAQRIEWQRSTNGVLWENIVGEQNDTLRLNNVSDSQNGTFFRAVLADACNNQLISAPMRLTVFPPPIVTFFPEQAEFGMLGSCTSSRSMTITIKNESPFRVSYRTPIFSSPYFRLVSPADTLHIEALGSISISILFLPSINGVFSGEAFFPAIGCGTPLIIPISGGRESISLKSSKQSIAFPATFPCQLPPAQQVDFLNDGSASLTISAVKVSPELQLINAPIFPFVLSSGGTLSVSFSHAIAEVGDYQKTITIYFTKENCSDSLVLPATYTVVSPMPLAQDSVIDIGILSTCEATSTHRTAFYNFTPLNITIDSIFLPNGIEIFPAVSFPLTLRALDSIRVNFSLEQRFIGSVKDSIRLFIRECDTSLAIPIQGERLAPPSLSDIALLDFGNIPLCTFFAGDELPLIVENSSALPITCSIKIDGTMFTLSESTATLEAGEQRRITVSLPQGAYSEGILQGTLLIEQLPCGKVDSIALQARFLPILLATPDSANIVSTRLRPTDTTVVIKNTADYIITLQQISVSLPEAEIINTTPALPATLAPGEELQYTLRFTPTETSENNGQFTITALGSEPCNFPKTTLLHYQILERIDFSADSLSLAPGERGNIIIQAKTSLPSGITSALEVSGNISWNETLLALATTPVFVTTNSLQAGRREIAFRAALQDFPLALPVIAGLGNVPTDSLRLKITGLSESEQPIITSITNGIFKLAGVWNDKKPQYTNPSPLIRMQAVPNPAQTETLISISQQPPVGSMLQLFDINGRLVRDFSAFLPTSAPFTTTLPLTNLSQGTYFLLLGTSSSSTVLLLQIE